ncbi:hypothetical protein Golob_018652 [Gossypium lobatum]|uniref:Uncharacterized protein n=1 Tax=Gossypium lobatum TaxID=34289 RepID=A0A7J8MB24_9ROSI|nr:hypothetical protein [Gossypium lobatum]
MHDLINNFSQVVAGDTCFKLEGDKQQKSSQIAFDILLIL